MSSAACGEQSEGETSGDASASDAAADGVATDGSKPGVPLERVLWTAGVRDFVLEACDDGACSDGKQCFVLAEELTFCDVAQPPEVTACPAGSDATLNECACDASSSCSQDHICVELEVTCSCQPTLYTKCVERACQSASDCQPGSVCIPSSLITNQRCASATCSADSDCSAYPGGRCSLLMAAGNQSGSPWVQSVSCVYEQPGGSQTGAPPPCGGYWLQGDYFVC